MLHVAEKLAGIYQIGLDEIARQTTENTVRLFKKLR
jgi:Tat protein secretion system quality control protein TatD with DNase activity